VSDPTDGSAWSATWRWPTAESAAQRAESADSGLSVSAAGRKREQRAEREAQRAESAESGLSVKRSGPLRLSRAGAAAGLTETARDRFAG